MDKFQRWELYSVTLWVQGLGLTSQSQRLLLWVRPRSREKLVHVGHWGRRSCTGGQLVAQLPTYQQMLLPARGDTEYQTLNKQH